MKNFNYTFSIAITFLTWFSLTAPCQAETWNWNPFSSKKSQKDASPLYISSTKSTSSGSWLPDWKMPQMKMPSMPTMPWSKSKSKVSSYQKPKPSAWQRMSKTSKKWWNKTAEVLDPYPEPKTTPSYTESTKKKSSWFTGWFQKEEPRKIETVNDFLGQEMVGK